MDANEQLGSAARPLRVAVVGSGPAGFFTAEALLRQTVCSVDVDVFERLPTPYGLVRSGVAPDHAKVKSVAAMYARTAERSAFRFFGNVTLGRDIDVADLRAHYDQTVYAIGNEADRRLGIDGEGLWGCVPAAVFVGWYNGHPDYRAAPISLDAARAVIVGNGNVAIDIARILSKTTDELAATDIADHALAALQKSAVREVVVLGRRGPAQAAFTPAELKELGELKEAQLVIDDAELILDEASDEDVRSGGSHVKRNLELLRELARTPAQRPRTIRFRFLRSPVAVVGDDRDRVRAVRVERNVLVRRPSGGSAAVGTGELEDIDAELVIAAVGFDGAPVRGVPFDAKRRTVANREGRVTTTDGAELVPNEYAVGWAATGAQGLIGAHRASATELVRKMLADLPQAPARALPPRDAIVALLGERRIPFVTFDDWKKLDAIEVARGARRGAPRSKLTDVDAMLSAVRKTSG